MILMYHKVDLIAPTLWWVRPGDLDRQIATLKWRQFVYLDDYISPATQAVITFDDAYENVHRHALPVLTRHGVPFEVFVIGNRIGDWNDFDRREPSTRHMGLGHLDDVAAAGGRLQWHTLNHPTLTKHNDEGLVRELTVPQVLRERYPAPHFTWLSYPGGAHDGRCVEAARRLFRGAVSVTAGAEGDRWQLNRLSVDRDMYLPGRPVAAQLEALGVDLPLKR